MPGDGMWSDEFLAQLAAMGAMPDEQSLLMKQMGMGESQSQIPMPTGQQVGRFYIAANPMEHAAAALQRFLGQRQQKQATQGLQDSFAKQTEIRSGFMKTLADELRRQRGIGQPPAAPQSVADQVAQYGVNIRKP